MTLFKRSAQIPKNELLFSQKDLTKLIIPLLFHQILNVAVGTIDSMMVAYAGEEAVSGVSLVSTLDILLTLFFTSLVGGGAVVIAQTLGKKDSKSANDAAKQLLYITTAVSVVITVIVLAFRNPLLTLLFGKTEAAIMKNASEYFFYIVLSFPLVAMFESISACFRSAGNTFISLIVALIINFFNICGNAVLIIGMGMEAAGAAISTFIARFVGVAVLFFLILQKKHPVHIEKLFSYKPDMPTIRKILYVGVPNGIEGCMFQFGRLLTQALVSTLGTTAIAANAVGLTICNFQYITGTVCSTIMITVVGRCIGAGDKRQAKYYSRNVLAINYIILWIVILFTMVFLNPLVSAYNLSDASAELAKRLILYHAMFAAAIWPIGFMLPSAFRAANDVRFPMIVSTLSMWLFRVAGAYVVALDTVSVFGLFSFPGLGLGAMGVWIAMTVDWVFRVALYLFRYLSGRWLRSSRQP